MNLECCLKTNSKKLDNIEYTDMVFSCDSGFKARFVQFDNERFKAVNDFVFNLVEVYFVNASVNMCRRIEVKFVSHNDNFLSLLMKFVYDDFFKYKSLNFDSKTMLPVSHKIFLKRIGNIY